MKCKSWLLQGISILLYGTLFFFLFQYDNKYETTAPYGKDGVYTISTSNAKSLYFLIDDWEFYENKMLSSKDATSPDQLLFIGQYPNFQLMEHQVSSGSYRMIVRLDEASPPMFFQVPEIFQDYRILINGVLQDAATGDVLPLIEKENEIVIQVISSSHYYSGMYYPPVVGTASNLANRNRIHDGMYLGISLFACFACAFMLFLRRQKDAHYFTLFAKMAGCFALFMLYPLYHDISPSPWWYCVEDFFHYLSIAYCIRLCLCLVDFPYEQTHKKLLCVFTFLIPSFCVISTRIILPQYPGFIQFYGNLLDCYKGCFCVVMLYCAYRGYRYNKYHHIFLLQGGLLYGLSLLINLFMNNQYEPIYGLWQGEYAMAYLLVLCFVLVIARFRMIMKENEQLNNHLEAIVKQRTMEITALLDERKGFFANMAHDLKAPANAIQMYIDSMRENGLYIDEAMSSYFASMERKNKEMIARISDLNEISTIDKISDEFESIPLYVLLRQVYEENLPESDVMGIHFVLHLPPQDVMLHIVKRKMLILFENIFYNALSFSEKATTITLSAKIEQNRVVIQMQDQGCGIEEAALEHIFDRYYSARKNASETNGLGLAIVKMIALEMHGDVWATSIPKVGTSIYISLPYTKDIEA